MVNNAMVNNCYSDWSRTGLSRLIIVRQLFNDGVKKGGSADVRNGPHWCAHSDCSVSCTHQLLAEGGKYWHETMGECSVWLQTTGDVKHVDLISACANGIGYSKWDIGW